MARNHNHFSHFTARSRLCTLFVAGCPHSDGPYTSALVQHCACPILRDMKSRLSSRDLPLNDNQLDLCFRTPPFSAFHPGLLGRPFGCHFRNDMKSFFPVEEFRRFWAFFKILVGGLQHDREGLIDYSLAVG